MFYHLYTVVDIFVDILTKLKHSECEKHAKAQVIWKESKKWKLYFDFHLKGLFPRPTDRQADK